MKTITVSNTYEVSGFLEQDQNYVLTKCGKVINITTRRVIKPYLLFGEKGYYIKTKFVPLRNIKTNNTLIECPF
jgi:hypothetical protein